MEDEQEDPLSEVLTSNGDEVYISAENLLEEERGNESQREK